MNFYEKKFFLKAPSSELSKQVEVHQCTDEQSFSTIAACSVDRKYFPKETMILVDVEVEAAHVESQTTNRESSASDLLELRKAAVCGE